MVFLYLALVLGLMLLAGSLMQHNPEPVRYVVDLGRAGRFTVASSLVELIGWSALAGAVAMLVPYLRAAWDHRRETRALRRDADTLRDDNRELRRDAENARTTARLLEARIAEAEERYLALETEARPLLEQRAAAPPEVAPRRRPSPSRWQKR